MTVTDDIFASVRKPLVDRPWPFPPLLAASGYTTVTEFSRRLGLNYSTVHHAAQNGCTDVQADEWAVRLGLHPSFVWADWHAYEAP